MESNTIHIGFDLDGVLLDHTATKVELARALGVAIAPEQTPSEVLSAHLARDAYRRLQELLYDDPIQSLRSPLMEGALDTLRAVREAGLPCTLISRRRNAPWALHLLEYHHLHPGYFDDGNTYFVDTPADKERVAARIGVTHYLDDELKVLGHLSSVPHRYLMDPFGLHPEVLGIQTVRTHAQFRQLVLGPR
jgi:hypothetical protein